MMDNADPRPYHNLIMAVLFCGVKDAVCGRGLVQAEAEAWILAGNRRHSDFRRMCDLVGFDAEAIRQRYIGKQLDPREFMTQARARS